jgi:hypothetical protein
MLSPHIWHVNGDIAAWGKSFSASVIFIIAAALPVCKDGLEYQHRRVLMRVIGK